jgi:hypothetical protein
VVCGSWCEELVHICPYQLVGTSLS